MSRQLALEGTTTRQGNEPGCVENGCDEVGVLIVKCGGGGGLLWCERHRATAEAHAERDGRKAVRFRA